MVPIFRMQNNILIDHIIIKSGYTHNTHWRGAHTLIKLPLKDNLQQWTFQAHCNKMKSMCTLQFEFYTADNKLCAKSFVLSNQLQNTLGKLTIPMVSVLNIDDNMLISQNNNHNNANYDCYNYNNIDSNNNHILIGEFNFEYFILKPFKHPKCGTILAKSFPKNVLALIGHRGTGSWESALYPGIRR